MLRANNLMEAAVIESLNQIFILHSSYKLRNSKSIQRYLREPGSSHEEYVLLCRQSKVSALMHYGSQAGSTSLR